jgi:hypothetical protein
VELIWGIAPVKAHQLRQLGVDPTVGVIISLIYSSLGFALFSWFAIRWLNRVHRGRPRPGQPNIQDARTDF